MGEKAPMGREIVQPSPKGWAANP